MPDFVIPVQPPFMEKAQHDFPISPRENLMRLFRHEKPKYVPCLYQATQFIVPKAYQRITQKRDGTDCTDWFGTFYKYEAAQEGVTPRPPYVLNDVTEWREKIDWLDLSKPDFSEIDNYVRDENLAQACRCFGNGTFEQLHFLEGFEQCLIDILTEPEECRAFFERLTDFKIEMYLRQNEQFHYDYACHNDDWSNARAQFFSIRTFEETLRDPSVRLAEAVRGTGARYMFHTCGKMGVWLPYIVNELKADVIEIQNINDTREILQTWGDRLSVEYHPDVMVMYNPATTAEQAREYARSLVDQFGAHVNPGAGFCVRLVGNIPESYYAFEDELYQYSLKMYRDL